jgi:hypothetical protein
LTKEGFKEIMEVHIPSAKEKLSKRKEYLKEWAEDEYQQALGKLRQWDR